MTPKPDSNTPKVAVQKPIRKEIKGANETARLFVNVDELMRRSQMLRMTRYVE
jgi:hypothetical protein